MKNMLKYYENYGKIMLGIVLKWKITEKYYKKL